MPVVETSTLNIEPIDILEALCGQQGRTLSVDLPSERVFNHLDDPNDTPESTSRRRVTYKLNDPSQCLRQASTLLSILAELLHVPSGPTAFTEHAAWLFDSIHALCNTQTRWDPPIEVSIIPLMKIALAFAKGNSETK